MTYVITQGCCNDASCISVCPVQCIRPRPGDPDFTTAEQLYIDPATCIDCGACFDECPVNAVHTDDSLPAALHDYLEINAEYFVENPILDSTPGADTRRRLPPGRPSLRVAIIGTGPAACYLADELSDVRGVEIAMFERLPVPFGLARAGVAPDHPDTKLITERFRTVLARPNVKCYFNVEVGRDVSVAELKSHYHAVAVATGASGDRSLGVPGEELPGSFSAREFVAWYNGHPDHADAQFDIAGDRVVIIGNGNVALDVARALARSADDFSTTDMADHAIAALRTSGVKEVVVAARRGPEKAAYTTGELMALGRLGGVDLLAAAGEVGDAAQTQPRRYAVLTAAAAREPVEGNRRIVLRFGLTPSSIDDDGDGRVGSVTFTRADGEVETLETPLVLRAVGYRGLPFASLPFSEESGTLPHEAGRVIDPAGDESLTGVYCAGWIKRGPSGGIGANKIDASETVTSIMSDFASGVLADPASGDEELLSLISERQPVVVDKQDWMKIDLAERERGRAASRPRAAFVSVDDMLAVLHS